ncbi:MULTISPECIES: hypothetical protein [Bacillus amyloliquefaciens group]|uniref:hypothetical protein n=1 Tax=Bacillus amyloliquefaciens group TaxID=1938374 RepID=UPI00077D8E8F|nr:MULTISPECIES: hypothetical protein [Bacillus amyloliquefaciens group]AMQ75609.1 hypothetical protein BAMY6614_00145 [Bacillus amyloliquefaciens UMAF6614]MBF6667045.1 hypothetical protein [Bacillus velezensis]
MSEAEKNHEFLKRCVLVIDSSKYEAARNAAANALLDELKKNGRTYGDILNALDALPVYNFTSDQREIIDAAKERVEIQMRAIPFAAEKM